MIEVQIDNIVQLETLESLNTLSNPFFESERIKLFNDNALNESLFSEPFVDLIVTSPPYNVGIEYNSNNDELDYEEYLSFSEI